MADNQNTRVKKEVAEKARVDAANVLKLNEIEKVGNAEYALETEDGIVVLVKLVVPNDQDAKPEDLAELYVQEVALKAQVAEDKQKAKEKKIARDEKYRAKVKAEKEAQKAE